jgi:GNAT superfamily N-acetyltransferase
MGTELDALDLDPRAEPSLDLELDADPAWDEIAEVNAAARGARPEVSFRPAMDHLFRVAVRGWLARVGGRPAAALITYLHEEDCYVTFVATLPEFRGHDLRRELLRAALRAARGAGATSSTLEATMLGAQVYSRLGYRPLGELSVWERRRAE